MADAPLQLRFDAFELDEGNARLARDGVAVPLPPKAFAVLCALAREPGRLITKERLLDGVWGHQYVSDSVLKTTISQLRAALDDDAKQPRYIETASRRGYRFLASSGAASAPPAPQTPSPLAPTPAAVPPGLVARRGALGRLDTAWQHARAGARRFVWVAGEPGIGKTTLIDGFVAGVGGDAICAYGQCVEQYGAGEPYLPVLEALAALCRQDPALPALLRTVAPTWLVQLPWLLAEAERAALQRELAGVGQERMLREMGELLDRYTGTRALVLVTEDLHWADHATVRLIEHVARRRGPARLLWLGSFRTAELLAGDHPLKGVRQELRAHRLTEEIALDPFSETEVAEYVGARFPGSDAPEAFVRALHLHTDGLPLFVANLLDDLQSEGAIDDGTLADAVLDGERRVPESLAGVIERQIERLPGELRLLLSAASAAGVEFRPETVADTIGREPAWVHERCDRLARRYAWLQLVGAGRAADGTLDARYAFRHALYRHVLYQRMSEATRVEMHLMVARSMERRRAERPATPAELASHFERGRDPVSALRHYADATAHAIRSFAPTEAERLTGQALALVPRCAEGVQRDELELAVVAQRGVACSQLRGVASPASAQAFERARTLLDALPPTPERAWVLSGLGWVCYVRGEFAASRAVAQRIHALAEQHGDPVLFACACNLLGVAIGYHGDLHVARDWLERGIATCVELGERLPFSLFVVDPEVSMRANLCLPLVQMGFADAARRQMAAALTRAGTVGQPMAQMLAHWCACMVEIRLHQPQRVQALAEALGRIVAEHGVAQGEGPALWYAGWAQAQLGDPETGYRRILEGFERHARFGMYAGCPQVLCYAAEARALAADWAGAQRHLDEGLALAQRMGETVAMPDLHLHAALVALGRGDVDAARAALHDTVAQARLHGAQGYEIEAVTRLCGLPAATDADARALREACATLPAGFDAALADAARSLMAAG